MADVDALMVNIGDRVRGDLFAIASCTAAYFGWRGVTPQAAANIETRLLMPTVAQVDEMFRAVGLSAMRTSTGICDLAEYAPLYFADLRSL
ncbi:MAG: hypothetical protein ACREXT_10870 [Gammaproteobacteria bacterium]